MKKNSKRITLRSLYIDSTWTQADSMTGYNSRSIPPKPNTSHLMTARIAHYCLIGKKSGTSTQRSQTEGFRYQMPVCCTTHMYNNKQTKLKGKVKGETRLTTYLLGKGSSTCRLLYMSTGSGKSKLCINLFTPNTLCT